MKRTPRRAPRPWEAQTPTSTPTGRTPGSGSGSVSGARTFPRRSLGASPRGTRGTRGTRGLLLPDGRWLCDCVPRRPAVQRQTRKPGPNQGRWFWTCAQTDRRRQCDFFSWGDEPGPGGTPSTIQMSIGRRTTPEPERQRPEPTTPTPMRRAGRAGRAGREEVPASAPAQPFRRIFSTPTSTASTPRRAQRLADPFVDDPPTPSLRRQRVRPITDYFHKDGQPRLPKTKTVAPDTSSARPASPSYSEDMDSETERVLLALTEHAERQSREEEKEEEEEPEPEPMATAVAGGIIVPTHPPPLSPRTPSRLRRGRGLLLAREERAGGTSTATATPPSSQMSGVSIGIKREADDDDDVFQTPQRPLQRAVTPPSSKKRRTATGKQDCARTTDALRLLDGEPVSAAVREQLRALLNREFAESAKDSEH